MGSHCKEIFGLSDAAVERLLNSCCGDGADCSIWKGASDPSVTFGHEAAVSSCGERVDLQYISIQLKAKIKTEDENFLGPILAPAFTTVQDDVDLWGLADQEMSQGRLSREWEWMTPEPEQESSVHGLKKPEGATPLQLARKT